MIGVRPQVLFGLATAFVKKQAHVSLYGREQQEVVDVVDVFAPNSAVSGLKELCPVFWSQALAPAEGMAAVFCFVEKTTQCSLKFLRNGQVVDFQLISTEDERRAVAIMARAVLLDQPLNEAEKKLFGALLE